MDEKQISTLNFCACMGPLFNQATGEWDPHCPCRMRSLGLPFDDNRLKWSEEDKQRLMDFLKKMSEREKQNVPP